MKEAIALVDANNFYCSCERVFDAKLRGQALAVLSNNDGCIISRSNEAKAVGLKMGEPYFKAQALIDTHNVAVYSSNYTLYGDMSARMHALLGEFAPEVEHYSIDEAFLRLQAAPGQTLESVGHAIKERIRQAIGIPVSVGIAETKTLAKVAGHYAKRSAKTNGVLSLAGSPYQHVALERLPVGEVWGVGSRYEKFLSQHGVTTARQLRDANDEWVREHMTVVGLRTVHELRGQPSLPFELVRPTRKSLMVSRSFGQSVTTAEELREAVAYFVNRAGEKLRRDQLVAGALSVWIETSRFKDAARYANSAALSLSPLTDATPELMAAALRGLQTIYRSGLAYKKAGVMLSELTPVASQTLRLWGQAEHEKTQRLMRAVDGLNARFGRDTVRCGLHTTAGNWRMKQERRSRRFTTRLDEVLRVN
jgi:DNA polymerase V